MIQTHTITSITRRSGTVFFSTSLGTEGAFSTDGIASWELLQTALVQGQPPAMALRVSWPGGYQLSLSSSAPDAMLALAGTMKGISIWKRERP